MSASGMPMLRSCFTTACARVLTCAAASDAVGDCARTPKVTCAISGAYLMLPLAETDMHGGPPIPGGLAARATMGATLAETATSAAQAKSDSFMPDAFLP